MSSLEFDPRMSIGNVLSISAVVVGIIAGWFAFESRLALAEDRMERRVAADSANDQRNDARISKLENAFDDTRSRLVRVESKLENQDGKLDTILRNTSTTTNRRP